MRFNLLFVSVLVAFGCAKPTTTVQSVGGSDDQQLEAYAAQLELLGSQARADDFACPKPCSNQRDVCELSKRICAITTKQADRPELQSQCAGSQEQCAAAADACSRCP